MAQLVGVDFAIGMALFDLFCYVFEIMLADKVLFGGFVGVHGERERFVEEANQVREGVAEETADAHDDVDPRATEFGEGNDFDARKATAFALPDGTDAKEREDLGDVVPLGSHGAGAPDVDTDRFRIFFRFGNEAPFDDFAGQFLADSPGSLGRECARIDRVEVATRGEDVGHSARGGTAGASGDVAAVEGSEQVRDFVGGLCEGGNETMANEGENLLKVDVGPRIPGLPAWA